MTGHFSFADLAHITTRDDFPPFNLEDELATRRTRRQEAIDKCVDRHPAGKKSMCPECLRRDTPCRRCAAGLRVLDGGQG